MQTSVLVFLVGFGAAASGPLSVEYNELQHAHHPAVVKFREYLRIDTSREDNMHRAVDFWRRQASELGLSFVMHGKARRPACVVTWRGADPALPSVILNSHMDVVGAEPDDWTYPPFSAHIDSNGDIYGRGAQDTKDVSIQYIEAIGRLIRDNVTLQRTFHITLMPDEETGGYEGMVPFLDSPEFEALNVGFALDEGRYALRHVCGQATLANEVHCPRHQCPWICDARGYLHGEGELHKLINAVSEYRDSQQLIKESGGPYNSININMINGGFAPNVLPGNMSLVVDLRLSPSTNASEINDLLNSWVAAGGNNTEVEFIRRIEESPATAVDDSNPYWLAMQGAASDMGITIKPLVCPATSDMLYVRGRGIPALGFAPKARTSSRAHGADEYLNVETFLRGIDIYVAILKRLGGAVMTIECIEGKDGAQV